MTMVKKFHRILTIAGSVFLLMITSCSSPDSYPASAKQLGSISGHVYLTGGTKSVNGVVISCAGKSCTSSKNGVYSISNISEGSQAITAKRNGYEPYQGMVHIRGDRTIKHDIYIAITGGLPQETPELTAGKTPH